MRENEFGQFNEFNELTSLNELTIEEASQRLAKREISSVELTKACLEAIAENEEHLQAFLSTYPEEAIAQAKAVDERRTRGEELPLLAGIPCAIKDNMLVKGQTATAASHMLASYSAPYDATVIRKLRDAGAVFLGKTNLDEFAMGSSTENSAFGPTKNPHDFSRVPGGSSGGSAAAVAAHETIYALGSDTGGSIRQPAGFCGVVGLKPTYGAVSRFGLIAMASSLDQIGPITKTVEDAALLYEAIRGKDSLDSTSAEAKPLQGWKTDSLEGMKIGLPREYFVKGMNQEVKDVMDRALERLKNLGIEILEVSLPHTPYALATYYIVMPAEVSANLARYDGIRYGYSAARESRAGKLADVYGMSRADGFGDEVRRRIMLGTYTLSAGYYEAYYLKAQKVRRLIQEDFLLALEKVDVILAPTSPTPAFRLGEKTTDPLQMYLEDIYTVSANLAGVPALAVPAGVVGKLPVGVQFIGKHFDEAKLFRAAYVFEQTRELAN